MHKRTSKAINPAKYKQVFKPNWVVSSLSEVVPANPWAALDAIMAKEQEPTGPEWFTQDDFEARYGFCCKTAWAKLKGMVKAGTLECWTGRVEALNRKGCKYRFKEAK